MSLKRSYLLSRNACICDNACQLPNKTRANWRPTSSFAQSFVDDFFATAAGSLRALVWSPAKQSGGSFRRERKIEAILLNGFSFARRSLHQQVRDLHEVVGKHGRRDPHLKTFATFGKAAVCTENLKSDHSGDEVRPGWRVN